jgi:choline dehydrogenase-like flavoprotein
MISLQLNSSTNIATPTPTNPLQTMGRQTPMAWLSSPAVKSSSEFSSLPKPTQTFLQKVPSYEIITGSNLSPGECVILFMLCVMNAESTGSITLSSSDPSAPPNIDLNYLSQPYDRRVAIEGLRALIEYSRMPAFAKVTEKMIDGPEGDSEEEIWAHVKKTVEPVFHLAGTCKMGREEDDMAVVDADFRVRGLRGVRVVDHSIAPLMVNNHTQSTCYLIVSRSVSYCTLSPRLCWCVCSPPYVCLVKLWCHIITRAWHGYLC